MINLTPHTVTVRPESGPDFVFPTSGQVARVEMLSSPDGDVDGCPCVRVEYGMAELPKALPDGVRAVPSYYYGSHEERGEGPRVVYLRVPEHAQVKAMHGSRSRVVSVDGVELTEDQIDAIEYVPEPRRYIVSTMFADAYRRQHGRDSVELFVPDSGPSALREKGQIVAVRALIRR